MLTNLAVTQEKDRHVVTRDCQSRRIDSVEKNWKNDSNVLS